MRELKCLLLSERSKSERLHIVWFQFYNILEETYRDDKQISGRQGFRK